VSAEALVVARALGKAYPRAADGRHRWRALGRVLAGGAPLTGTAALSDVDLTLARGESVAIVGENGAGKSTLLKLIAGVLRPSDGTVETRGRVCRRRRPIESCPRCSPLPTSARPSTHR